MELDGRSVDGVIETEICVIGAGPAGLALATELVSRGTNVLVLESGALTADADAQSLNDGATIGDRYAGLRATRHRQVGGSANVWNSLAGSVKGGKYAPLDPADLAPDPESALSGWPLPWTELEHWYRRAQPVCGLGAFDYGAARWTEPDRRPFDLSGTALQTHIYQLGAASVFTGDRACTILQSPDVRLAHHATVCGLETDRAGQRVTEARVSSLEGGHFSVRASSFVLAAGAIENARILLASSAGGLRTGSSWVGRCFMEHPRDYALELRLHRELPDGAAFYDAHEAPEGVHVTGRLALAEEVRRRERLPNFSITLLPCFGRSRRWSLLDRKRGGYPRSYTHWPAANPAVTPGAFVLLLNLEQRPHPDNRVVLGAGRDRLGVPAAELHWRWRAGDQAQLERVRAVVARELEGAGLGVVRTRSRGPDPNAHHHAGTTRMSVDASSGVVDRNGRVHGTENLYVAGASVFPTSGFANPTLTIVALALRLAAHLCEAERATAPPTGEESSRSTARGNQPGA
jgi:choline dehydrogenase-like flavoprotein